MPNITSPFTAPSLSPEDSHAVPLITIITVVRNGGATLAATLGSVAAQSLPGVEYVVVDGQSTDRTLDILEQHRDTVTTLVSEADKGIYDAMNKGLGLARGRWVLFLGADDTLIAPDILARVAPHLKDTQRIYYGDVVLRSSGRRYCGPMSTYRLMQQNICHQAIFYPAAIYRHKAYDLEAGLLADYKYNLELWGGPHAFEYLDLAIVNFEDRGASSKPDQRFETIRLSLIERHLGGYWAAVKRARTLLVRLHKRPKA